MADGVDSTWRDGERHDPPRRGGGQVRPARRGTTWRRGRLAVAVLAALALVLTACSDDDDGDGTAAPGDGDGGGSAELDELLGAANPATGQPLRVGFISDGRSESIDNSAEIPAARAAAEYVNAHLGGIAGRPLELVVCENGQTPAGATQCVNEMARAQVPVVLVNVSGQSSTIVSGLTQAGIPSFWWIALDPGVATSPQAFVVTNSIAAAFAGPAKIAQQDGIDNAAELVIDVPAISGPARLLASGIYQKAGVSLELVIAPPAGDITPQVQAALSSDPGLVHVTGNDTFCIGAVRALRTLGYDGEITIVPQCLTEAFVDGVPGGIEGVRVLTVETKSTDDEEVARYEAVIERYGDGTDPGGSVTSGGYAAVVGFARAASGLTGEVSPQSVLAAVKAMDESTMPLSESLTFRCDGSAVGLAPAICSTATLVGTLDAEGVPGDFERIETADLLDLG